MVLKYEQRNLLAKSSMNKISLKNSTKNLVQWVARRYVKAFSVSTAPSAREATYGF